MRKQDAEALIGLLNEAFPDSIEHYQYPDSGEWGLEICWSGTSRLRSIHVNPKRKAFVRFAAVVREVPAPITGLGWREAFVAKIKAVVEGGK